MSSKDKWEQILQNPGFNQPDNEARLRTLPLSSSSFRQAGVLRFSSAPLRGGLGAL